MGWIVPFLHIGLKCVGSNDKRLGQVTCGTKTMNQLWKRLILRLIELQNMKSISALRVTGVVVNWLKRLSCGLHIH